MARTPRGFRLVEDHPDGPSAGHGDGDDGDGTIRERLKALETHVKHLATKADLQAHKNDLLKWQLGILATTVIACIAASVLATVSLLK